MGIAFASSATEAMTDQHLRHDILLQESAGEDWGCADTRAVQGGERAGHTGRQG